jgi:hypothetical protein
MHAVDEECTSEAASSPNALKMPKIMSMTSAYTAPSMLG